MMERLKRILQAAIGDVIEKASDPELGLVRFIEDIEIALGEVRAEIEEMELRKARLEEQIADGKTASEGWMRKAERAIEQNDDNLARQCLLERREADAECAACVRRREEVSVALMALGKDRDALDRKLRLARLEQKRLSTELRRAESEQRAGVALSGGESHAAEADKMRQDIQATEALGEAIHAVKGPSDEAQFEELDETASIDAELAALKMRMKKK